MVHYPITDPKVRTFNSILDHETGSFVKRVSRQSNYKNICKTVVKKHQFWMCNQLLKDQHVLIPSITSSPRFKSITLQNEDECIRTEFIRLIPSISPESEIVQSSVKGT